MMSFSASRQRASAVGIFGLVLGTLLSGACASKSEDTPGAGGTAGTAGTGGVADPCSIGTICHDPPNPTAETAHCHEVGHGSDVAACQAIYDQCVKACTMGGGGMGGTGGSAGTAGAAGSGTAGGGAGGGSGAGGSAGVGGGGGAGGSSDVGGSSGAGGSGGGAGGSSGSSGSGGSAGSSGAGGSGGSGGGSPDCTLLVDNCTPVDEGSGAIHDCVVTGQAMAGPACTSALPACTESCGAALCTLIGDRCHDGNVECHDLGHEEVAKDCFDRGAECLMLCPP